MMNKLSDWLPTTNKEVKLRGWEELDVILFSGDAYVDHPAFGHAVVGRILESYGLRVAIVPQPSVNDNLQDFTKPGMLYGFNKSYSGTPETSESIFETAISRIRSSG